MNNRTLILAIASVVLSLSFSIIGPVWLALSIADGPKALALAVILWGYILSISRNKE